MQGEKGEPGMVIGADGSALSTLAGPPGPKGVKVMIVALLSHPLSALSLSKRSLTLFSSCVCSQGDLGLPGPAGLTVSTSSVGNSRVQLSGADDPLETVFSNRGRWDLQDPRESWAYLDEL